MSWLFDSARPFGVLKLSADLFLNRLAICIVTHDDIWKSLPFLSEFTAVHLASNGILSKMLVFRSWSCRSDACDYLPSRGTRRAQVETLGSATSLKIEWFCEFTIVLPERTAFDSILSILRGVWPRMPSFVRYSILGTYEKLWPWQTRWHCPDPFSHCHLGRFGQELGTNLLNYCCEVNNRGLSFSSDKIGFMAWIATILLPNPAMSRRISLPHSTPGFCQFH